MSFDPSDASVSAYATLRIAGDSLDPQYVTEIVSLKPSEAWRKGDLVRLGKSEERVSKESGMWLYRTSDAIFDQDLHHHLDFLLYSLGAVGGGTLYTSKASDLKAMITLFGLQLTVSLFWHGRFQAAEPQIPSALTDFVSFLGGRLVTDFASDEPEPTIYLVGG